MTDEIFTPVLAGEDMVPEKYRIAFSIEQRQYLCDGSIKEWTGPQQDVLSPICEAIDNIVQQKRIGSYPQLACQQVMEALDAACRAYDHGKGAWPTIEGTLSVSDALRFFTIRMLVAAKATDANRMIIKSILTKRSSRFLSTDFIL